MIIAGSKLVPAKDDAKARFFRLQQALVLLQLEAGIGPADLALVYSVAPQQMAHLYDAPEQSAAGHRLQVHPTAEHELLSFVSGITLRARLRRALQGVFVHGMDSEVDELRPEIITYLQSQPVTASAKTPHGKLLKVIQARARMPSGHARLYLPRRSGPAMPRHPPLPLIEVLEEIAAAAGVSLGEIGWEEERARSLVPTGPTGKALVVCRGCEVLMARQRRKIGEENYCSRTCQK